MTTLIIDFKRLLAKWDQDIKSDEYPLLMSKEEFEKVELIDATLVWKNIEIELQDEFDEPMILYYDLGPMVLYEEDTYIKIM